MPERIKHLPFEFLPYFQPGYFFSPRSAWIDRFVIRKRGSVLRASSAQALREWLRGIASENDGINFSEPSDGYSLEISNDHWLFSGQLYFRRPISGEDSYSATATLNLNLMRYAAHSLIRNEKVRPPPHLKVKPINEADGRSALRKLHRLQARSLAGSDNYFGRTSDFERYEWSAIEALGQYLRAVERELQRILSESDGIEFEFSLAGWSLSQLEVLWEFEERNALAAAEAIGDRLWRYSFKATKHSYALREHHMSPSGQRSISTTIPLRGRSGMELTCYAKTKSRLRVEVRYNSHIRNINSTRWSLREFPNDSVTDLSKFIRAVAEDASVRARTLFATTFQADLALEESNAELIAEALTFIATAFSEDEVAFTTNVHALITDGIVTQTTRQNADCYRQLVSNGVLRRHRPRQRNSDIQYVLTERYRGAFDLVRNSISDLDGAADTP